MASESRQPDTELLLVSRCISGDKEALGELRATYHEKMVKVMVSRGATPTQAEDLAADLWGDCVADGVEHPSHLEKYSGKCSLQSWLLTVATRRLIDLQRKLQRRANVTPADSNQESTGFFERVPDESRDAADSALIILLRESLKAAFASCPPEGLLMLRLVHLHGLKQRALAAMWCCHEAKISRVLGDTLKHIQKKTLEELKKRDPLVRLTWEDFVSLCETHDTGFL